jgi:3-oxoacyl-[acyl-carrier-protein] synthase-1
MADNDPVIIGIGMKTAVGLTAKETAAAVRAATMRFSEVPIADSELEPIIFAEVPEDGLSPLASDLDNVTSLTTREARLLRLGITPLAECLTSLPAGSRPPALALALPDYPADVPIDGPSFLRHFAAHAGGLFDASRSIAVDRGRAGGLLALQRAGDAIRTGQADVTIAGAIDTYRDLYVLGSLDEERRVKSESNFDGLIPGEAAAFVLLATARVAAAARVTPLARVSRVSVGAEAGHLYSEAPYRGDGLAAVVTELVNTSGLTAPFGDVWSSMNGESHWAKEWSVSYLRNRAAFVDDHGMQHPADSLGDAGAACGPVMIGLAAMAISHRYGRAPAMVYCSSDRGERAAVALTAV